MRQVGRVLPRAAMVVVVIAVVSSMAVGAAAPRVADARRSVGLAQPPAGAAVSFGETCVSGATALAAGPDGAIWFTIRAERSIGRLGADGEVTTFSDSRFSYLGDIAAGPDGALWFTTGGPQQIARMTVDGAVSMFEVPGRVWVDKITAGPGGMWFTMTYGVGRVAFDGRITTFEAPDPKPIPDSLALGPDGAMWWTDSQHDSIGRVTTEGVFTQFQDPAIHSPIAITAGPDGALWFTAGASTDDVGGIGRITIEGVVTELTEPDMGRPRSIVTGSDAALWFTDEALDRIGRVTTGGEVAWFTGNGPAGPGDIASGADGALWFVNGDLGSIGRVAPDGEVTIPSGSCVRSPRAMAHGPDGSMWFVNAAWDRYDRSQTSIGRLGPDGVVQEFVSPLLDHPLDIVAGPDGAMWFTNGGSIGRITMSGAISVLDDGGVSADDSITVGPDGALWFTEPDRNSIGRVTVAGELTHVEGPEVDNPSGVVSGSDGALWFSNLGYSAPGSIGRISTSGSLSRFDNPSIGRPNAITAEPDGALWFAGDDTIGRITTAGTVSSFAVPVEALGPLVAGADGSIWFVHRDIDDGRALGRITSSGDVSVIDEPGSGEKVAIAPGPGGRLWFSDRVTSGSSRTITRMDLLGAPGPPNAVVATPSKGRVTVTWQPPALLGSSAPVSYAVVASPGGQFCTRLVGQTLECSFTSVTSGQAYTFAVTATSAAGVGAPFTTDPVVPWSGSAYHDVPATRILDSRTGQGGWPGPLPSGATRTVQVTGPAGVPASATAVVLNVTVTDATAQSYLAAWPTGSARPTSSALNFLPGDTIANLVTVKVGAGGKVSFANAVGKANVVIDIAGYYDDGVGSGGLFNGLAPQRALDSRDPTSWWDGAPLQAGDDNAVPIVGEYGVPVDDVSAVVVNVTATQATNDTFLTLWSASAQPQTSNLNVRAGQTIANLVIVPIEPDLFHLFVANAVGSVDVIIDVVGYFSPEHGNRFHATAPTRVLDDRNGTGLVGPWGPGQTRTVHVGGVAGIPANATGVAANLTVTGSSTESFISAFPHGTPKPLSSSLNFGAGQTIANATYLELGSGTIDISNALGTVDVIADVSGYFGPD